MAGVEELNKRWEAIAAWPIARDMSFDGDFLILGAQTHLAKVGATLDEPRLVALLAAAHGRLVEASSLRQITRALEKKRDGHLVLALIHLALSGVAKMRDPKEDARRLFLADGLMAEGVDPSVIIRGLGLDLPLDEALRKYCPDQPRIPAGNPDSGQRTREDGSGSAGAGPHADSARPEDVSATPGSARTASLGVDPVSGPRLPDATTPDPSLPVGKQPTTAIFTTPTCIPGSRTPLPALSRAVSFPRSPSASACP
jgi:hypothetical protein